MNDVSRCPNCNTFAYLEFVTSDGPEALSHTYHVRCAKCNANAAPGRNRPAAIRAWNKFAEVALGIINPEPNPFPDRTYHVDILRLRNLAEAGLQLFDVLYPNVGNTADFPIRLTVDDPAIDKQLRAKLSALKTAVDRFRQSNPK